LCASAQRSIADGKIITLSLRVGRLKGNINKVEAATAAAVQRRWRVPFISLARIMPKKGCDHGVPSMYAMAGLKKKPGPCSRVALGIGRRIDKIRQAHLTR